MEQILPAYGLHKVTVTAIMMLYKNTKAMIRLPDKDIDFFEIFTEALQGDALAPYFLESAQITYFERQ